VRPLDRFLPELSCLGARQAAVPALVPPGMRLPELLILCSVLTFPCLS
jgi:hypothetical protein